ncbi:GatB/YqeY domain-containing protein [Rubrivirga sp. IMCC43871]|uniref:GatB/YqeY domain-containing protein n=1 Tax=Rubrivirga sp. IMCC43871 TaxID=3391575 RepID=UPI00398FECE6
MLKETLARDLKDAMRQKDKVRLGAIRMLQSAITTKEKEAGQPIDDDTATAIVAKQVKQRRDSIQQFTEAGRDDLAEREAAELGYIEAYLPAQATDEDIHAVVQAIVTRTGATTMKDMGRVMGEAMSELKGVADGGRVQTVVRALLGA